MRLRNKNRLADHMLTAKHARFLELKAQGLDPLAKHSYDESSKAYKAYAEKNRENIAARMKTYVEANADKIMEQCRVYKAANKEKIMEQRKDYAKAREICDRLLAQFPDDALACYGKAYALAQEGNLTAALEYATKARAMDPGSEMIGRLYNQLVQAVGR